MSSENVKILSKKGSPKYKRDFQDDQLIIAIFPGLSYNL